MRGGYTVHSLNDPFLSQNSDFELRLEILRDFFVPAFFFLFFFFFFSFLRVKEYIYEM